MRPLVSILIPAHNAEKYLAETLRSALDQTWTPKEIIVVDDGSRDGTLAIAKSFESAIVKVISQENKGQSSSENRAISESQGDLIEFLDSDDLMTPNKLAVQVHRLLVAGQDCIASCRWGRFRESPEAAWFVPQPFWQDMAPVDWLVACWERHSMMHGAAWLIPRPVIDRAGLWDPSLSLINDFDFFTRVLLKCRHVCFCPAPTTYYRSCLPASLSGLQSAAGFDSAIRSLEAGTSRLLDVENSPRTRRACVRQFQEFVYSTYPYCPELVRRAECKIAELGGGQFRPQGGPLFRLTSRFVGWRLARRLQRTAGRFPGLKVKA
jgi:glycosyltransferase involved in cell wall biosynthesis